VRSREGQQLALKFQTAFGHSAAVRVFAAPGRVNLIGEHTDYNDGFVMPAAIGMYARAAVHASAGRSITARSLNAGEIAELDLNSPPAGPRGHWSDYVFGVALMLEREGVRLPGASLLLEGTVPLGSGLSSSAALEVVTAFSLLSTAHRTLEKKEIAKLCRRAENEFVGARVGIMDQLASCLGREGHALLIDCRTLDISNLPIPDGVGIVVCNTMVKHALASGEYNRRRTECEEAVHVISARTTGVTALRDVSAAQLDAVQSVLDPVLFRRARHVITENQRVLDAARALDGNDAAAFGPLLRASHRSLRDDFEVSCRELDVAVEIANSLPGVYGSRMMGGGFGGCTITLAARPQAENVAAALRSGYRQEMGADCEVYICAAVDGASEETSG
jgi:galactokinase